MSRLFGGLVYAFDTRMSPKERRRKHRQQQLRETQFAEALLQLGATRPAELHLAQVERAHVKRVMRACLGNVSLSATVLGMHRRTLQRWLERARPAKRKR